MKQALKVFFVLAVAALPILSASPVLAQGAEKALTFDGDQDYIFVSHHSSLNMGTELTIEAWVKPSGTAHKNILMKGDYGYGFMIENSTGGNNLGFWDQSVWANVPQSDGAVTMGAWQHVAVSVEDNGTTLSIEYYINGISAGSKTSNETEIHNSNTDALYIGRQGTYYGNWYNGQMDELRLWNVVRTQSQIQANMCSKLTGSESGLVAYWRFDDSSNPTDDYSANSNTGTILGGTSFVTSTAAVGDKSHVGTGTDSLVENADVPVDITWDDDPGASAIFSAIQVDAKPDVATGLLGHYPATYWELWIANDDASFQGDAEFHYDNIGGIGNENTIYLYTRSAVGGSWSAVSSYTLDKEDNDTDGVGSITADDLTGFSQFIITSSEPENPLPELPTIVLLCVGLLGLGGYLWFRRSSKKSALGVKGES